MLVTGKPQSPSPGVPRNICSFCAAGAALIPLAHVFCVVFALHSAAIRPGTMFQSISSVGSSLGLKSFWQSTMSVSSARLIVCPVAFCALSLGRSDLTKFEGVLYDICGRARMPGQFAVRTP